MHSWHKLVHDWAFRHFPDPEYGEWFGYLHRDGSLSVPLKGNQWKGGFHVPRMYWKCWMILEEMKATGIEHEFSQRYTSRVELGSWTTVR